MILIRLMGGLGNQMFQYALGTHLAKKNKTTLKVDLTLLNDRSKPHEIVTHRGFDLADVFSITPSVATESEAIYYNGKTKNNNIFDKLINSFLYRIRKHLLVFESGRSFQPEILKTPDNRCLVGAWQSEKYFEEIQADIRNLYKFRHNIIEEAIPLKENIVNKNSVCLHVRRGDYVTSPLYAKMIGFVGIDYYLKAVETINEKVENPYFFIFSDEPDWCIENFHFLENYMVVDGALAGHKASNHLQLMSLCKHFIISNSTFAWWGAWLGEKEDSIIIAPKQWVLDENYINNDIIPDRWTKI